LALECGVELDDKGTAVYDHFNHQAAKGASDPALITTTAVVKSPAIFAGNQPQVNVASSHYCCVADVVPVYSPPTNDVYYTVISGDKQAGAASMLQSAATSDWSITNHQTPQPDMIA